jgi:hypothetical protein
MGRLCQDTVVHSPSSPFILTPKQGNLHRYKALTNCVLVDLMLPPYLDEVRDCHYYTTKLFSSQQYAIQQQSEPDDFRVRRAAYPGPR